MSQSELEKVLDAKVRDILPAVQERIMTETRWFGVKALKNPLDFWVYQEILFDQKPEVIIEIGNNCGGSTYALAHMCDLLGAGRVIGIDISHAGVPEIVRKHPRISLIEGDACGMFATVKKLAAEARNILIIEDSSHEYENTLNVLNTYAPLIPVDGYFIVEDGICHHGLDIGPKPGPYEAIETFVAGNRNFVIDAAKESFILSWNPKGFLKRVS